MEDKIDEAKIIDYLYGELPTEEHKEVDAYLKKNPQLLAEIEGMNNTRSLLGKLEDKEMIAPSFVFDKNETKTISFFESNAFRWVASIAAGFAILLVSASLLQFNIVSTNQGTLIGFGEMKALPDEELNKENVQNWMSEVMDKYEQSTNQKIQDVQTELTSNMEVQDEQNLAVMSKMMNRYSAGTDKLMQQYVSQLNDDNKTAIQNYFTASGEQQKSYVKNVLADFNEFYQNQRNRDIKVIETSMNMMKNNQNVRQLEQDQLLVSLYDMVNTQNK